MGQLTQSHACTHTLSISPSPPSPFPPLSFPPPPPLSPHTQQAQLEAVQAEEREMLETKSLPLRNYLMRHVLPTVTQGLIEVSKAKPEDPVDYLVS